MGTAFAQVVLTRLQILAAESVSNHNVALEQKVYLHHYLLTETSTREMQRTKETPLHSLLTKAFDPVSQ